VAIAVLVIAIVMFRSLKPGLTSMFDGTFHEDTWQPPREATTRTWSWELAALVLAVAGVYIVAAVFLPDALNLPIDCF
jgi:hypothetical protein